MLTKYSSPAAHTLCWISAPPNLNFSAHVFAKVMLGAWFLWSIGPDAPQLTFRLSFGGKGFVADRKGLNISSMYGMDKAHRTQRLDCRWSSLKKHIPKELASNDSGTPDLNQKITDMRIQFCPAMQCGQECSVETVGHLGKNLQVKM